MYTTIRPKQAEAQEANGIYLMIYVLLIIS